MKRLKTLVYRNIENAEDR